ncbi:hypothetical protein RvY_09109 [Ramazzottius varieornatus]|uniref:Large ribosomal subunit protein uL18m n=1 Tax=Ramazzottius varieornatus TaxID=947166 RepID=A0A1D1V8B4_RAMVA|nr:hypothetical protein RvY_09109 [Ramazzottius varieornatus]
MSLTLRKALTTQLPRLISLNATNGNSGGLFSILYVPSRTNFTPPRKSPNLRRGNSRVLYQDIPRIPGVTCAIDSNLSIQPEENTKSLSNGVITEFVNRNPRNLEMMNLARKRSGWGLEADRKDYHYKISFQKNAKHTTGNVVHSSGRTVVSASTSEYGISKFLYRNTDLSAAENIGRVLARRMLETGIVSAYCDFTKEEREGTRVSIFLKGLSDSGIQLEEKRPIVANNPFASTREERIH